jgi:hypothetical protein
MMIDIGRDRLIPGGVTPPLPPRTTTVLRIIHHHKSDRPEPNQPIKLLLKVTDQHRRFHFARLSVPSSTRF